MTKILFVFVKVMSSVSELLLTLPERPLQLKERWPERREMEKSVMRVKEGCQQKEWRGCFQPLYARVMSNYCSV